MAKFALFAGDERLDVHLHARRRAALHKMLRHWDPDLLLNTADPDAVERIVEAGAVSEISLHSDRVTMDFDEVDKKNDPVHDYRFKGNHRRVKRVTVTLPFEGDARLLRMQVRGAESALPFVEIVGYEIRLTSDNDYGPREPAAIRAGFDATIETIERLVAVLNGHIRHHNEKLAADTPGAVAARKQEHLADKQMQAEIGYPMRVRPDAASYAIPISRRRLDTPRPAARSTRKVFAPEPAMAEEHYEEALGVLQRLRNGFERNPTIAADAVEEQIRDLLLFHLNGHFEGLAAAEVFNRTGKTDILIRVDDRNVFIAECKIWGGPKRFAKAIDQLLRYLAWRDTKAALLIFVRQAGLTAIMRKSLKEVHAHPAFKRDGQSASEDRHDFVLRSSEDRDREIRVALMFFQLPPRPASGRAG